MAQGSENMDAIDLDRRFTQQPEGESEDWTRRPSSGAGKMTWEDVLGLRRVVILAEAGGGKSSELKLKHHQFRASGRFSFNVELSVVATMGLPAALPSDQFNLFSSWKASGKDAWFFIDSIDEAKAERIPFHRACARIAEAIRGCEDRASIVLTGRPSDWRHDEDFKSLVEYLSLPKKEAPRREFNVEEAADAFFHGKRKQPVLVKDAPPAVLALVPLDEPRIVQYAKSRGIDDVDGFLAALKQASLVADAGSPRSLNWLADQWRSTGGTFAPLRDMLELSIDASLVEHNGEHEKIHGLTAAQKTRAINRIGAALVLRRCKTISIGETDGAKPGDQFLQGNAALPDLDGPQRLSFYRLGAFDPDHAGYVKLRNDNNGAVRSFLAARWLQSLLVDRRQSIRGVEKLIVGKAYGHRWIRPSMRATAAWLSISSPSIAATVAETHPLALMTMGDPESLPASVKINAVRVLAKQLANGMELGYVDLEPLRRFADGALSDTIADLWNEHRTPRTVKELLLLLVREGGISECLGLVKQAACDLDATSVCQMHAVNALAKLGSPDDRAQFAEHVRAHLLRISPAVLSSAVEHFFPTWITENDLLTMLREKSIRNHTDRFLFGYCGGDWLSRVSDPERLKPIIDFIADLILSEAAEQTPPRHDFAEPLATAALRLAQRNPIASEVQKATVALAALEGGLAAKLIDELSKSPISKQAFFFHAASALPEAYQRIHGNAYGGLRITSPWRMAIDGVRFAFDLSDLEWLLASSSEAANAEHADLIATTIRQIWFEAGRPADQADLIHRGLAALPPAQEIFGRAMVPPPEPPIGDTEESSRINLSREEHERALAENRDGFKRFIEALKSNPAQLLAAQPITEATVDRQLWNVFQIVERLGDSNAPRPEVNLPILAEIVGAEAAEAFRKALIDRWRGFTPRLHHELPADQRNIWNASHFLGRMGVHFEAASDSSWIERLDEASAATAVRYGMKELNGWPWWFDALAVAWPEVVKKAVLDSIEAEWQQDDQSTERCDTLETAARANAAVQGLISGVLLQHLTKKTVPRPMALEPTLAILRSTPPNHQELLDLCLREARSLSPNSYAKAMYLGCAFGLDAEAATECLEGILNELSSNDQTRLATELMPGIFGGDWGRKPVAIDSINTSTLERLAQLAHKTIRPEDDLDRPSGVVFSPNVRDHAETARHRSLNALIHRPGSETFEAINRLAALPEFDGIKTYLSQMAMNRSEADSDGPAADANTVIKLEMSSTIDLIPDLDESKVRPELIEALRPPVPI